MSTQDKPLEIIIDYYKFKNFQPYDNSVAFDVEATYKENINQEDKSAVELLLKNLGKWDCLLSAGINLISDLKIISSTQKNEPSNYKTKFGPDLYGPAEIKVSDYNRRLNIIINLTYVERQKRTDLQMKPIFPVEEIIKQIVNIPKWLVFQKTLDNLREATTKT